MSPIYTARGHIFSQNNSAGRSCQQGACHNRPQAAQSSTRHGDHRLVGQIGGTGENLRAGQADSAPIRLSPGLAGCRHD